MELDIDALNSLKHPTRIERKKVYLEPTLSPVASPAIAAGFAGSAVAQSRLTEDEQKQISGLIEVVLQDPLLQRKLCDRVYSLMLEEARQAREITAPYGSSLC